MTLAGLWLFAVLSAAAQQSVPELSSAQEAASSGRWSEAERLYRSYLQSDPRDPDANLGLAQVLEEMNSPESAIAFYLNRSLDEVPEALSARARLLMSLQRYNEAVDAYSRLIALQGVSLDALFGLAKAFSEAGRWAEAADAYEDILQEAPKRLDARLSLGIALQRSGQNRSAIAAYQSLLDANSIDSSHTPEERHQLNASAAVRLAPLLEASDPLSAAAVYLRLPSLYPSTDPGSWYRSAVQLLCQDDPQRAQTLYRHLGATTEDAAAIMCVADALYALQDPESASSYRKVITIALQPDAHVPAEHIERCEKHIRAIQLEEDAARLSLIEDQELGPELKQQVQEARALAKAGRQAAAIDALRAVAQGARHSSEAWVYLGDMQAEFGDIAEAESAYRIAVSIAPTNSHWRKRLALLLAEHYGGTRHDEAIDELNRVIRDGPHPPAFRFFRGVMLAEFRKFEEAVTDLETYLEAEPDGEHAEEAAKLLMALKRSPPEIRLETPMSGAIQNVPKEAERYFRRARALHEDESTEAALLEVRKALEIAPNWQMALNLHGDVAWINKQQDEALTAWEAALQITPPPPGLRLKMAMVYTELGQTARAETLLVDAADAGTVEAFYELAALSFDRQNLSEARRWLELYFDAAPKGPDYQAAMGLQVKLDERRRRQRLALGVTSTLLLVLLGVVAWRRQRQRILDDLIEAAPECAHDLARLLSAVRHEVLKHNTTLLEEMAFASQNGDHSALRWAAERLLGEDGGAVGRYVEYRSAIERLGKKHGVHLDLRRTDPVFAPMSRAMSRLAALESSLKGSGQGSNLEATLLELHEALNVHAYQALGRLIQQMGTLMIDEQRIQAVDARVRAEPGIAEHELPPLQLYGTGDGIFVRVFSGDFSDIVANLLRNAYFASIDGLEPSARQVAVVIEEDDDPITGAALVAIRFCDHAPGALSSEMLHGRSIGRGLGLAVDLIARHNGSIDVEDEPGWKKAVVVRLPHADGDDTEVVDVFVSEEQGEP